MRLSQNIKPLNVGVNEVISINHDGKDYEFSLIDDLKFVSSSVDFQTQKATINFMAQSKYYLVFELSNVKEMIFSPDDTYGKYNTHGEGVDLATVDQLLYDPHKIEMRNS